MIRLSCMRCRKSRDGKDSIAVGHDQRDEAEERSRNLRCFS